jgi:hypothetical protein
MPDFWTTLEENGGVFTDRAGHRLDVDVAMGTSAWRQALGGGEGDAAAAVLQAENVALKRELERLRTRPQVEAAMEECERRIEEARENADVAGCRAERAELASLRYLLRNIEEIVDA